ncbi:MAG: DUF397 domain-containing protein [Pseudonocardia sp.]
MHADEYLPAEAFEGARWQKSTVSDPDGSCVEFAKVGNIVAIRDSKVADGSILQFNEQEVRAMFSGVKNGEFDHFFAALLTRSSEREETS